MKIAFCHNGGTHKYSKQELGSGYENIAYAMEDKTWWSYEELADMSVDVALITGDSDILRKIGEVGRPPWEKIIMLEEAGISVINTPWYINRILRAKVDGFLVHSRRLLELFNIFGKPVYYFTPPYPFFKREIYNDIKKDETKVGLYIQRAIDPAANVLSTLRLLQLLPKEIIGYCHLDGLTTNLIERMVDGLGMKDRVVIKPAVSWDKYIEEISDYSLFLSMDDRHTFGRFDCDAAMVGSRCVGAYTEAKKILFPQCMVESATDILAATIIAKNELFCSRPFVLLDYQRRRFSDDFFLENLYKNFNI